MQNLIFIGSNRGNRDFKDFISFWNLTIVIKTGNLSFEIPNFYFLLFLLSILQSHTFPREKNYDVIQKKKEKTPISFDE